MCVCVCVLGGGGGVEGGVCWVFFYIYLSILFHSIFTHINLFCACWIWSFSIFLLAFWKRVREVWLDWVICEIFNLK